MLARKDWHLSKCRSELYPLVLCLSQYNLPYNDDHLSCKNLPIKPNLQYNSERRKLNESQKHCKKTKLHEFDQRSYLRSL